MVEKFDPLWANGGTITPADPEMIDEGHDCGAPPNPYLFNWWWNRMEAKVNETIDEVGKALASFNVKQIILSGSGNYTPSANAMAIDVVFVGGGGGGGRGGDPNWVGSAGGAGGLIHGILNREDLLALEPTLVFPYVAGDGGATHPQGVLQWGFGGSASTMFGQTADGGGPGPASHNSYASFGESVLPVIVPTAVPVTKWHPIRRARGATGNYLGFNFNGVSDRLGVAGVGGSGGVSNGSAQSAPGNAGLIHIIEYLRVAS